MVEFAFIAHFFNRGVSIRVPLITWCIYDVIALVFLVNLKDLKRRAGSGHGARVAYWIFLVYTIGFGFPVGSTTKVMICCILFSTTCSKQRMHSSRMRTARLLPVSPSMHCSRGWMYLPGGCTCSGVYLPGGCTCQGEVYLPRKCTCLWDVPLGGVPTWGVPAWGWECTCPGDVPARGCTCQGVYLPGGCTCLRVYLPGGFTCHGVYLPWGCTCQGEMYLPGGCTCLWGVPLGVYLPGEYLPGGVGMYLPGDVPARGCTCPGGVPAQGVYLPGGVPAWGCTCLGVYLPGGFTCHGVYLPVGCTCQGEMYLPGGCTCPGGWGCTCQGVPAWEVPAQGGTCPAQVLPPVNRMTNRCKNITLPQ